jgi:hypothetical protein
MVIPHDHDHGNAQPHRGLNVLGNGQERAHPQKERQRQVLGKHRFEQDAQIVAEITRGK